MYFVLKSFSPFQAPNAINRYLRPTRLYVSSEINKPGRLIAIIDDDDVIDELLDETDKSNPNQMRSPLELFCQDLPSSAFSYDNCMFQGRVFRRDITKSDGNSELRIEAMDNLGTMAETVVLNSNSLPYRAYFTTVPEYFQATNIDMVALKAGTATYQDWFYPALSETQAWCPVSGAYATVYTTSLDGIIGAADTTITTNTTNHRRMKQRGIIKIVDAVGDDEYVYYNGYGLNAAGDGYEFRNCIRGCLGVAASAHTDAELELRQFVPARMYIENGDWSLDYATAPKNTRIIPHAEDGYFEFGITPTSVTATYKYINENDAAGHDGGTGFWLLSDVLETILERARPVGPFLSTTINSLALELPDIVMPAVAIYGMDTLSATLKILDERGLTGHVYDAAYPNSHPRVGVYQTYNSTYGTVNVTTITQVNATATVWPGFTSVRYGYSMEDTFSAVTVIFTDTGTGAQDSRTVHLTDTHDAGNYDSVLDADAYKKITGYGFGTGRVKVINRGEMTEYEATSLAETILRQSLVLPDSRVYEVDQFPARATLVNVHLGDTIHMPDGFNGLLTRYDFRLENGIMHATLYLTDTLTAGVL